MNDFYYGNPYSGYDYGENYRQNQPQYQMPSTTGVIPGMMQTQPGMMQMQPMMPQTAPTAANVLPVLPSGQPLGPMYSPFPTVPDVTETMPITIDTQPTAQTLESIQYTPGFMRTQIGRRVRVDFLIGTNTLVDKAGTLVAVGASYIILKEDEGDDLILGDLYSIKFVEFFF